MRIKQRIRQTLTLASVVWLLGGCSTTPDGSIPVRPAAPGGVLDSYVAHKDERSGLPTFIWLSPSAKEPAEKDASSAAWSVLRGLRTSYRMSAGAMDTV